MEKELFIKHKERIKKVLFKALETEYYGTLLRDFDINSIEYEDFLNIPLLDKATLDAEKTKMLTYKYHDFSKKIYDDLDYGDKRYYMTFKAAVL